MASVTGPSNRRIPGRGGKGQNKSENISKSLFFFSFFFFFGTTLLLTKDEDHGFFLESI